MKTKQYFGKLGNKSFRLFLSRYDGKKWACRCNRMYTQIVFYGMLRE